MKTDKEKILEIIHSSIESVKPGNIFPKKISLNENRLQICGSIFNLDEIKNIFVVGIGKASAEMALRLENILGSRITAGIAVTKEGHSSQTKIVKVIEASHPYPDERSLTAGNEILSLCNKAKKKDLVINLISGGGSVLAEVLKEKIKLAEWIELNKFLINSGADISEINSIRQKISKIKNGGLLSFIYPAESISLIISDVIGDKLEFIASGPTFYKQTNINTILEIINKYQIDKHFSKDILDNLIEDPVNEKPQHSVKNFIIANNDWLLINAKLESEKLGYNNVSVKREISGEVEILSKQIAKDMINKKNTLLIYGGESTVKVKGKGKGGRNQELVLRIFNELKDTNHNFVITSAGSDGTDGPTEAAGAILTSNDINNQICTEINSYLDQNDSYNFHKLNGSLINTGPTKTNVMDLIIGYLK